MELADERLPAGWIQVRRSAFTRVAYNEERQFYYKEFITRSPAESLRASVRGSRASRARTNADALQLAGIDAPESIAWGSLPGGREYLFTAAVPGEGVDSWLRGAGEHHNTEQLRLRRHLLYALGTFIGRVHATGFVHGDLRPRNVLAELRSGQFRFALVNNENNTRKNPIPGRTLLRNLTELNMLPPQSLGCTDRMRFFCAWRRQMRHLSAIETKILAVEAYRRAMLRLKKHQRQ